MLHRNRWSRSRRSGQCPEAGSRFPCTARMVVASGIPVVVAVERIQQGTVLTDQSGFCCGGSCIDTKETVALIGSQITGRYVVLTLAFVKRIIIFLGCEQRFHTCHFKIQFDRLCQTLLSEQTEYTETVFFCIQGGTDCCKQMRIFRNDGMLFIQFQSADKGLLLIRTGNAADRQEMRHDRGSVFRRPVH